MYGSLMIYSLDNAVFTWVKLQLQSTEMKTTKKKLQLEINSAGRKINELKSFHKWLWTKSTQALLLVIRSNRIKKLCNTQLLQRSSWQITTFVFWSLTFGCLTLDLCLICFAFLLLFGFFFFLTHLKTQVMWGMFQIVTHTHTPSAPLSLCFSFPLFPPCSQSLDVTCSAAEGCCIVQSRWPSCCESGAVWLIN